MMRAKSWLLAAGLLLGVASGLAAQEVAGSVVDSRTGRGIEGARVAVQGAQNEARTDAAGRFRLTGVSGTSVVLSVTMIGYRPTTHEATVGRTDVRILIVEQAINLGEIVVTGTAGGAEKRTLGNSVTTVRAADVQEIAPAPDISNLINSRAPGVVVIPATGQIGAGPRIKIRGTNSFSLNDQPLIYIDGVRVANDVATGISVQGFGSGIASRLNDIDPDVIDRIEIIKGPAASTLYGTEAANGVVQIFTKRGQASEKPKIAASIRQGTSWFMNPEGRIREPVNMVNGQLVSWNPVKQEEELYKQGQVDRPLFTNGFGMGYGLNISGGTGAFRYFAGATYDDDNGIEPSNDQRRFTGNVNLSITPDEKYDIQGSFGFVKSRTNQAFEAGSGGIWFSTIFGDPAIVNTPNRGFLFGPPEYQWGFRQASQLVNRFTASITVNHRPTSWLSHRLTVGQDQTDEGTQQLNRYLPPEWIQFNPGIGRLGLKYDQRRTLSYLTFDYNANVNVKLSDKLGSTSTVGAQYYRRRSDLVWAQGEQFPAPDLETIAATAQTFGFDDYVENSTVGVFAQQQFAINDKLYLTGAVRIDNNSAFGEDFDFVTYPKVSASYVVAEGQTGTISALKLRAAYGQSGQQPESFAALRSYQPVTGGDGGPAVIPQFVGNPDLAPERSTELEMGFEGGLFDDLLAVDFNFYYQKTRDAILLQPLAPSTGFAGNQFVNIGAIRNVGIELQLSATPINSRNLTVRGDFNLSHNKNKVLDLGEGVEELGTFGPKVGYPVDAIFRRKAVSAELNSAGQAINVLCDDGNGGTTAACSSAPGVYLGVWDPTWEGSFSPTVTLWGRLRLYGLVDFKLGNRHFDNNLRALCQVFLRCDENFNPQNYDPLMIAELQSNNIMQSWVINDASFAKLRELSASYAFPQHIARYVGGSAATLTLSARNLHTWTNWTGLDPEAYFATQLFTRLEQDNTPQLASFMATLNITF
ncbi:MAG: SusC/RagA family TonB-linked outer membrane protein [Gemmatimonadales bacterium]